MKLKPIFFLFFVLVLNTIHSQKIALTNNLFETYEEFKESSLDNRRIKHHELQPLISNLQSDSRFTIAKVGESIEGRDLSLISIGTGKTSVFLWSQMHGDEPTATQAIFDILNFLKHESFQEEKEEILSNLTLHFLPMLNPDGAEVFQRRNTLGIDINRDALRLQSPEGRTLKRVRDSLEADFGFNLHDQSTYYNAERTDKPATISYLAPAYNYEKEINKVRANAMKVIVFMNNIIQDYAPGQVGRYNDDFEPRAFGDNIQKWGTSAILIESGGNYNDVEKQQIRKLNYVSILSAIYTIANGTFESISLDEYEKIPENDRKLFDLKLENVNYELLGKTYRLDLGIHRAEIDDAKHEKFYYHSSVTDQGDLSTYYGYETLDATEYTVVPGKVHTKTMNSIADVTQLDPLSLLRKGVVYVRVNNINQEQKQLPVPLTVITKNAILPDFRINEGAAATFLLQKNGQFKYAVVNGFLINLSTGKGHFKNALVLD